MSLKNLLIPFLVCIIIASTRHSLNAQAGVLDASFGTSGKVVTTIASEMGYTASSAIQADGKIVIAGTGYNSVALKYFVRVIRYNTDGTLDNTFGSGGKVTVAVGMNNDDDPMSVLIQNDGRILVGGYALTTLNYDVFVLRLKSDGTLDNTFGTTGVIIRDLGADDYAYCMALQSDGKIILGGATMNATDEDFAVCRFNGDGTIDNTFGTSGKFTTGMGTGSNDAISTMAIQADGKIVLGGSSVSSGGVTSVAFARLSATGVLDNTYATAGKLVSNINAAGDYIYSMALQSDGKIVAAGSSSRSNFDILLVRLTTAGAFDNTFGTAGKVYGTFGNHDEEAYSMTLQPDGKILVGGYTDSTSTDLALMRLTSAGVLDNTFGTNGKVSTDFAGGTDIAYSIALQSDGKIVLAGGSGNDYAVARYRGDAAGTTDAGLTVITVPASKCGVIGNNQTVTVTFKNNSSTTLASGAVSVNLVVSGANTGSYNATNSVSVAANASSVLTYSTISLPAIGNNVFTATLTLAGDANATNNSIVGNDTAFAAKPVVSFSSTNASNTYNFTSTTVGKAPMTYKWNFGDGSPVSNVQNPSHHYPYVATYTAKLVVTDACGADSTTKIIDITTGIINAANHAMFIAFPNPAHEQIHVKYPSTSVNDLIVLTDLLGNIIATETMNQSGETIINTGSMAEGVYLISINNSTQKIFVTHGN